MNASLGKVKRLFHSLTQDELKLVLGIAHRSTFEPGQIILRQEQSHNSLFLVEEGVLHVERSSVLLGQITEGGFFGEVGFFVPVQATATVRAASKGSLYEIRRLDFDRFLDQSPALGCKVLRAILQQLGERLANADQKLVDSICWGSMTPGAPEQ